jgi:hypothetical protein
MVEKWAVAFGWLFGSLISLGGARMVYGRYHWKQVYHGSFSSWNVDGETGQPIGESGRFQRQSWYHYKSYTPTEWLWFSGCLLWIPFSVGIWIDLCRILFHCKEGQEICFICIKQLWRLDGSFMSFFYVLFGLYYLMELYFEMGTRKSMEITALSPAASIYLWFIYHTAASCTWSMSVFLVHAIHPKVKLEDRKAFMVLALIPYLFTISFAFFFYYQGYPFDSLLWNVTQIIFGIFQWIQWRALIHIHETYVHGSSAWGLIFSSSSVHKKTDNEENSFEFVTTAANVRTV